MYHNPFDILDPRKEVYRINLAELAELIQQDHAEKYSNCGTECPNTTEYFIALADGHDLATMNIPIGTIAHVYGIDVGMLAIKKAKYVDGTQVVYSAKLCQKFIIDQLSLWYHQIFSGETPKNPTKLMELVGVSDSEQELHYAMIRATVEAQERKLQDDAFYQHVIATLLTQFAANRDKVIDDIRQDPPLATMLESFDLNHLVSKRTSFLAYWYRELERLNAPDAGLPDFQELLLVGLDVFDQPINYLLDDDATYRSPEVGLLSLSLECMRKQFIDQMQGIFFWTYKKEA